MTNTASRAVLALSLPLLVLLPVSTAVAQTKPPAPAAGAMPHDKTMTCEMIAGERTAITEAVAKKAEGKAKSAKLKKGLFGFAKNMATAMVPGAALLGGNSMLGSLAAQGAGQTAMGALSGAGAGSAKPVAAEQPTPEQAARLARLDAIGTYRQCAA